MSPLHGGVDRNSVIVRTVAIVRVVASSRRRGSKQLRMGRWRPTQEVASSRRRGSKPLEHCQCRQRATSPLHGGVDRNLDIYRGIRDDRGRLFTEAWIETSARPARRAGAPRRLFTEAWIETASPPPRRPCGPVASSRRRGSKLRPDAVRDRRHRGRLFTEAWIETRSTRAGPTATSGRLFTEAWIETYPRRARRCARHGRLFTEAWIETRCPRPPAAGCRSPLHGGVDRNADEQAVVVQPECRLFTEAWIETSAKRASRACALSPLHGGVDRNRGRKRIKSGRNGRLFTEAWIETSM